MFGFFKRNPPSTPLYEPYKDKRWFIQELFDKIFEIKDPNLRLQKYIYLIELIIDLEHEFGCECLEAEHERDNIRDTFLEATDITIIFSCALSYGIFQEDQVDEISRMIVSNLQDHLKIRLLRTYLKSKLDSEKIDPIEFEPKYQHIFYELEKRNLNESEKAKVLEQEFGIKGWKSHSEMNPIQNLYVSY